MEEQMGHYRIVRELGRGAMGVVYLAHEDSLNRTVALKVLAPNLSESEEDFQRFHREAKSLAQLNHRNIVQIYFVGEDRGRHFFAMEYVPSSLQQLLRDEGRLESSRAAQLVLNAATGLAAAHERGIIHRDVKPANMLVAEDGILKVADFGIARMAAASTRLTAADAILGTPRYISPEQCEGIDGDVRSDIYSLGVTYYEMLSGRAPFRSTSALALVREILQDTPPAIEEVMPEVDQRTRTIVGKMMAKNPAERYQSAHELAGDLQSHLLHRIMPDWDGRSSVAKPALAPPAAEPRPAPPLAVAADASSPAAAATTAVPDPPTVPHVAPATRPLAEAVATSDTATSDTATSDTATSDTATSATWHAAAAGDPRAAVGSAARAPRPASSRRAIAALAILVLAGAVAAAALWQREPARLALASAAAALDSLFAGQEADGEPREAVTPAASPTGGEPTAEAQDPAGPETDEWTAAAAAPLVADAEPGDRPQRAAAGRGSEAAAPSVAGLEPRTAAAGTAAAGSSRATAAASTGSRGQREPGREAAPRPPRGVAVAVWGDHPLIAGALEEYLWAHLASRVELVSETNLAESLVEGQPTPGPFLLAARDQGARHVVLATTTFLSERPLYYYGRQDTSYQSRVTLEIVDALSQQQLSRWSGTVEYAALQTESFLDEAIATPLAELLAELR